MIPIPLLRIDEKFWAEAEIIGPTIGDQGEVLEVQVGLALHLCDDHHNVGHILSIVAGRVQFSDDREDRWVSQITDAAPGINSDAVAVILLGVADLFGSPDDDCLVTTSIDLDIWIDAWLRTDEARRIAELLRNTRIHLIQKGFTDPHGRKYRCFLDV